MHNFLGSRPPPPFASTTSLLCWVWSLRIALVECAPGLPGNVPGSNPSGQEMAGYSGREGLQGDLHVAGGHTPTGWQKHWQRYAGFWRSPGHSSPTFTSTQMLFSLFPLGGRRVVYTIPSRVRLAVVRFGVVRCSAVTVPVPIEVQVMVGEVR